MKGAAKREWILRSPDPAAVRELSIRHGLAPAATKVLVNRGIVEPRDVERFLGGTLSDLPDPSLLKDVDKAARRLAAAGSDRKSTRLNSSHVRLSRMPSSA